LARAPGGAPVAHLLRGQAALANLEFERAVAELEIASKANLVLPRLDYSLGIAYVKLGRNREAVAALERALARTPRDSSTLYYLAYAYEAAGDPGEAERRVLAALTDEPDSAEANALLGRILLKRGRAADAVRPLELAVSRDTSDSEKHFLLARAYQQL